MINRDTIRYLSKTKNSPLNIIVIGATHERYESALCETGHNFYSIKSSKEWNTEYDSVPKNYYIIDELPHHVTYDLILCHTSCDRLSTAVSFRDYFNIPLIRMTHVLPDNRFNINDQVNYFHRFKGHIDLDLFISEYNARCWHGEHCDNLRIVHHGLDTEIWQSKIKNKDRQNTCMSVVNFWKDRDWCCGYNLWKNTVNLGLKHSVYGNNEGLSIPLEKRGLVEKYNENKIYLNTSLHSPVPMALLEAMACGCIPISTNNCMIPEIIEHGKNGLLGDTPDELYGHCRSVMMDDDLAKSLSYAASTTIVNKFNINQFTQQWNENFENILFQYGQ